MPELPVGTVTPCLGFLQETFGSSQETVFSSVCLGARLDGFESFIKVIV